MDTILTKIQELALLHDKIDPKIRKGKKHQTGTAE